MSDEVIRFRVGSTICVPISDGGGAYPREWVFAGAPPEERDAALAARGISGDVPSDLTCLVVETGRNTVLIDTGIGAGIPGAGRLMANLDAAGYAPETIDTVIITHGHPDHIGGLLDADGEPAFPYARHVMWEGEWEFWTSETTLDRLAAGALTYPAPLGEMCAAMARAKLPPIRERLDLISRPGEIVPGIEAVPAPGHSPYQFALTISSGDERLFCIVDVASNPLQLEHPEWTPIFDQDPEQALITRRRILDQAASEESTVFVYHYPFPGFGRVVRHGNAWRWEPEALSN